MGMTPERFFESFVEGNTLDCHSEPGDVRRAFNAAVAASHFADQFFNYNKRHNPDIVSSFVNIGEFVEHLNKETDSSFKDIRSISNAYKHLYTHPVGGDNVYSSVTSSGAIDAVEFPDDAEVAEVREDYVKGETDDGSRQRVIFRRKDGTVAEFLPELENVVDYFRVMIYGAS